MIRNFFLFEAKKKGIEPAAFLVAGGEVAVDEAHRDTAIEERYTNSSLIPYRQTHTKSKTFYTNKKNCDYKY